MRSKVAYSVYPVGFLLQRICQKKIDAVKIQDEQMVQVARPIDNFVEELKNVQFYFHIGDLEPYNKLYSKEISNSGVKVVDLSSLNAIYYFQRYSLIYLDGKETYIQGPYYNGDTFNDIDMPDRDLFLWIDPIGMISMAKDIVSTLSANYVEEAEFFKNNFKALEEDLINLDADYQKLSQKLKKENKTVKFVSMSNSFGNWQKAYGFQVYPISLSKYGTLPTDKQLYLIKQRIKEDNVKYIAYEPNMTKEMIDLFNKLETELNLVRVNLSNVSSLTETQKKDNKDYLSLMYENLTVLENMATDIIDNKSEKQKEENSDSANSSDSSSDSYSTPYVNNRNGNR